MFPQPQITGPPTVVTFDPELSRKVDIVEEQIDFSSARKQFLQADGDKRSPAPQIYSAKPYTRTKVGGEGVAPEAGDAHVTWSDEGLGGEFTCARAVMTMVRDEEEEEVARRSPAHPEESDSGLDELSVRSQDTAPFSLDSVSDSGASLPPTPQPLTPVNGRTNGGPTEEELEFHAGVLVQNALRSALAVEGVDSGSLELSHPVPLPAARSPASPPCSSSSSSFSSPDSSAPATSGRRHEVGEAPQELPPSSPPTLPTSSPPPQQQQQQPQRPRNAGPRIKIQSSYARALASSTPAPPPVAPAATVTPAPRPTPVYRPPSPPSPDKPEFSYFSKYSEAAELRSTAATASRAPEAEPASGPFRLRSKKQRTLSMIEEEIRAAQQREEELKKQRETQPPQVVVRGCGHTPGRGRPPTAIAPADKIKSNSLPAKLTLTARTAPGQRTAPVSGAITVTLVAGLTSGHFHVVTQPTQTVK